MTMALVPLNGGRPVPIDKAIVFFGRGADCDVVLTNSRKVSRKHCCVAQIDNHFLVRDLDSMNGVRVNNQPVDSEAPLKPGDELWVGDVGFVFQLLKPNGARNKVVQQPNPDLMVSTDIPVALPDEKLDFKVEESMPQKAIVEDEVIELDESDILDDE